jgi:hypothetical protein
MIWKVLAIGGGVCTLGLLGFLYWFASGISDGFASAFGYPRPKRWRRG